MSTEALMEAFAAHPGIEALWQYCQDKCITDLVMHDELSRRGKNRDADWPAFSLTYKRLKRPGPKPWQVVLEIREDGFDRLARQFRRLPKTTRARIDRLCTAQLTLELLARYPSLREKYQRSDTTDTVVKQWVVSDIDGKGLSDPSFTLEIYHPDYLDEKNGSVEITFKASPSGFVALADKIGDISPNLLKVLDTACAQALKEEQVAV